MSNKGIPIGDWSGSAATDQLRYTIEGFSREAQRQTETMIRLTRWIVALTVVLVAGLVVQIVLGLT